VQCPPPLTPSSLAGTCRGPTPRRRSRSAAAPLDAPRAADADTTAGLQPQQPQPRSEPAAADAAQAARAGAQRDAARRGQPGEARGRGAGDAPGGGGAALQWLPAEDDFGNVEYKLRLREPLPGHRFQQLVTQMQYRLSEGAGECFYYVGTRARALQAPPAPARLCAACGPGVDKDAPWPALCVTSRCLQAGSGSALDQNVAPVDLACRPHGVAVPGTSADPQCCGPADCLAREPADSGVTGRAVCAWPAWLPCTGPTAPLQHAGALRPGEAACCAPCAALPGVARWACRQLRCGGGRAGDQPGARAGVEDDGYPRGLPPGELAASLAVLRALAAEAGCGAALVRTLPGARARACALLRVTRLAAAEAGHVDLRIAGAGPGRRRRLRCPPSAAWLLIRRRSFPRTPFTIWFH